MLSPSISIHDIVPVDFPLIVVTFAGIIIFSKLSVEYTIIDVRRELFPSFNSLSFNEYKFNVDNFELLLKSNFVIFGKAAPHSNVSKLVKSLKSILDKLPQSPYKTILL